MSESISISVLTDAELVAEFKRVCLEDPTFKAMRRGEMLWGDLILREEPSTPILASCPPAEYAAVPAVVLEWSFGVPCLPGSAAALAGAPSTPLQRQNAVCEEDDAPWAPIKPHRVAPISPPGMGTIRTLIARNLPRDINIEALRDTFEPFGPIKDIYIPKNMDRSSPYFGTIKGFALIKFLKPEHAAAAWEGLVARLKFGSNKTTLEFAKEDR